MDLEKKKIYLLFEEKKLFPDILEQIDSQIKNLSHKNDILKVFENGFLAVLLPDRERLAEVATI